MPFPGCTHALDLECLTGPVVGTRVSRCCVPASTFFSSRALGSSFHVIVQVRSAVSSDRCTPQPCP
ncbi:hypothetical protein PISMIDRAFT_683762 [Pisolithus microcarpus 441]|uniref:Unplaced genomic scaffold scaffold_111, whole genome shotgun sequence n=1 Tax=Pisolithus microcarpus 441 TaxID=765257 RepID=A0A0C9YYC6_9AGAM|nr:hypothetical protein PISMIDRAFT_683762 [Pisolithus microcarpus 441]